MYVGIFKEQAKMMLSSPYAIPKDVLQLAELYNDLEFIKMVLPKVVKDDFPKALLLLEKYGYGALGADLFKDNTIRYHTLCQHYLANLPKENESEEKRLFFDQLRQAIVEDYCNIQQPLSAPALNDLLAFIKHLVEGGHFTEVNKILDMAINQSSFPTSFYIDLCTYFLYTLGIDFMVEHDLALKWLEITTMLKTRIDEAIERKVYLEPKAWNFGITINCTCNICKPIQIFLDDPNMSTLAINLDRNDLAHAKSKLKDENGVNIGSQTIYKVITCAKSLAVQKNRAKSMANNIANLTVAIKARVTSKENHTEPPPFEILPTLWDKSKAQLEAEKEDELKYTIECAIATRKKMEDTTYVDKKTKKKMRPPKHSMLFALGNSPSPNALITSVPYLPTDFNANKMTQWPAQFNLYHNVYPLNTENMKEMVYNHFDSFCMWSFQPDEYLNHWITLIQHLTDHAYCNVVQCSNPAECLIFFPFELFKRWYAYPKGPLDATLASICVTKKVAAEKLLIVTKSEVSQQPASTLYSQHATASVGSSSASSSSVQEPPRKKVKEEKL